MLTPLRFAHKPSHGTLAITLASSLLFLSACQSVTVSKQQVGTSLINERANILTSRHISQASQHVLFMGTQQERQCLTAAKTCVDKIMQLSELSDEQRLSASSEVYLASALALGQSRACNPLKVVQRFQKPEALQQTQDEFKQCTLQRMDALGQSLRYSYAYLFASQRSPRVRLFDDRQIQVLDFYNQAISQLVTAYNLYQDRTDPTPIRSSVKIGKTTYNINLEHYDTLKNQNISRIRSAYSLGFSGLGSLSKRDGFGAELVVELDNLKKPATEYALDPFSLPATLKDNPNIQPARYLPASVVIEPEQQDSVAAILASDVFKIRFFDPFTEKTVQIQGNSYPLSANFSAPYGLWLAKNNLGAAAYWGLLDREQNLTMPRLFMLEPYDPNKKVLIMLHGLASSPEAWISVTNNLMGDPVLRSNYQVWQIFYSTNMPIIESRYQIYALIKQSFDAVDTLYPNQPAHDAVLIGHSMGGVIARLLVSNDDLTNKALTMLQHTSAIRYQKLRQLKLAQVRLNMHPIPAVNRVVLMSAPLQGTDYAERWFTLLARKIIRIPQSFLKVTLGAIAHTLAGELDDEEIMQMGRVLIQNGAGDLSRQSIFMQLTHDAKIAPSITYHSIMGNDTDSNNPEVMSDGIVPYQSAHLAGAASEKIIHGGHSIQETPEAIFELRRILRLHLQKTKAR